MKLLDICVECGEPSAELDYFRRCPKCFEELKYREPKQKVSAPYFKEVGVENPIDPKGSTAHVRDIKQRRIDTKTRETFYYKPPKRYFFKKGESL